MATPNFEFNSDGSLKLPKNVEESRRRLKVFLDKAEENPSKVIVTYEELTFNYEDAWTIILPKTVPMSILFKLKKWTNKQHKISYGSAWIEQQNGCTFVVIIKGKQNRCTWAHAFLNGLNTALIKDYGIKIKQKGTCKHHFYVKNGQ